MDIQFVVDLIFARAFSLLLGGKQTQKRKGEYLCLAIRILCVYFAAFGSNASCYGQLCK